MSIFRKAEVTVLKEADNLTTQINELEELEKQAQGDLKEEINKTINALKRGNNGEKEIMFQLNYCDMDMFVIRDLFIECEGLTAQIDYYIVTPKLHFLLECKNLYGNITINDKGEFIRAFEKNGKTLKTGIESPISQNERHMTVLKRKRLEGAGKIRTAGINKTFESYTKPLVVLANKNTVINDRYAPDDVKNKVIRADNLGATIKSFCAESRMLENSRKEMLQEAQYVLSFHCENRTDYAAKYREAVKKQKESQNHMKCPRCGANLVRRNGKRGAFIGCSSYPKCRFTKDITEKG